MSPPEQALPVEAILDDLGRQLKRENRLVLQAEPGAGKSTLVPMHLIPADWLGKSRIMMLEPRRIAARNLAGYLAEQLGEPIGKTVGLQIRDDWRAGSDTRLEIVTEGILTRRIQSDPELPDVGLVIFDEFHERHLQTDLALALALDAQRNLRTDLRILLMSATIDAERLAAWLECPSLVCEGRSHAVEIRHEPGCRERFDAGAVARACRAAQDETSGDVLAFLPGRREIEATAGKLSGTGAQVRRLYGALPLSEQRQALGASESRRIVLATNIAESSLTVPGVRAVVDTGLERRPEFHPASGLTRLVTRRVSMDSADQRAGRAGRLGPGVCLRLWAPEERLETARQPEILTSDLTGLVLELKAWGCEPAALNWLDSPAPAACDQGGDLLLALGALDTARRITAFGRRMLRWGTGPRLAAMLESAEGSDRALACEVAALLEGRYPMGSGDGSDDLHEAWERWKKRDFHGGALARLDRQRDLWRRRAGLGQDTQSTDADRIGAIVAAGYPDRIARRASGTRYRLANGRGVHLRPGSGLTGSRWLVVCEAALETGDSPVRWAARLNESDIDRIAAERAEIRRCVFWDEAAGTVRAEVQKRLGEIVIEARAWKEPPGEEVTAILLEQLRKRGLQSLRLTAPVRGLLNRVRFAHYADEARWPDWSEGGLLETLNEWLAPYLGGVSRLDELARLDFKNLLLDALGWNRRRELDRIAPERIEIPSGRLARIDYSDPQHPSLAVKLQEMFGSESTPSIARGRVPLRLELLSPAGRPLQITQDLAHFWANGYPEVRKEMRGRYPKHPWPEDPLAARPTARTKKAMR